jgi:hypothetical protein
LKQSLRRQGGKKNSLFVSAFAAAKSMAKIGCHEIGLHHKISSDLREACTNACAGKKLLLLGLVVCTGV